MPTDNLNPDQAAAAIAEALEAPVIPHVEVLHQGHRYLVPVLTRLQMDGAHDKPVGCAGHGNLTPPMFLTWNAARVVFVLTCPLCHGIAGAIRPAADA